MTAEKGQAKFVNLNMLELDPENPRLPEKLLGSSQTNILNHIARTTSIEELMEAIGENGYFNAEPLLAYKPNKQVEKYRIIEGNRRLTALLLLSNPKLLPRPKIATIVEGARHKPERIPVIEFETRDEVLVYLGYRHITGVKQWEPLAKARYLYQLYQLFSNQQENSEPDQLPYKEIAKSIGSKPHFVKNILESYSLYKKIEDNDFYDIDGLDELSIDFSLLSTAFSYEGFKRFLELKGDIISGEGTFDEKKLKELTRWLFEKSEDGKSRIGESRNLKHLNKILDNKTALVAFTRGASIESSYRMTIGVSEDFQRHLYTAYDALTLANGIRPDVVIDSEMDSLISKIFLQSKFLSDKK